MLIVQPQSIYGQSLRGNTCSPNWVVKEIINMSAPRVKRSIGSSAVKRMRIDTGSVDTKQEGKVEKPVEKAQPEKKNENPEEGKEADHEPNANEDESKNEENKTVVSGFREH